MPILKLIQGRPHDLGGGMTVKRLLPAAGQQAIGPFIFFDHFGPVSVRPQDHHDVRPHPHIGLATVTYLLEGAMMHRDSLGCVQRIEPGAINWMTAGRGIVHSERRPSDLAQSTYVNHGLQLWAALPQEHEESEPGFIHTSAEVIPEIVVEGARVRVLVGSAFGKQSPVATLTPTLYLDVDLAAEASLTLEASPLELGVYSVGLDLQIDGEAVAAHTLAILRPNQVTKISARQGARFVVIGGQALDGHRHIWWNFVASRLERINEAKLAWAEQAMGSVPGETDWIPLPAR